MLELLKALFGASVGIVLAVLQIALLAWLFSNHHFIIGIIVLIIMYKVID